MLIENRKKPPIAKVRANSGSHAESESGPFHASSRFSDFSFDFRRNPAGDLYHYQEQRTATAAPKGANPAQLAASRAAIEALIKSTGGQLWLAHDRQNFQRLKKAPAYYD
jgi:hypothetical protein